MPDRKTVIQDYIDLVFGMNSNSPTLLLKPHQLISLSNSQMLDCIILDAVSYLLSFDAQDRGFVGFVPPTILFQYATSNKESQIFQFSSQDVVINMHHVYSHYVTSFKRGNQIVIYDSIAPNDFIKRKRIHDLSPQLKLLFGDLDDFHINVICPQSQGEFNMNCGLFAIANAIMLMNGENPVHHELRGDMRSQLLQMLGSEHPQLRPFISRPSYSDLATANSQETAKEKSLSQTTVPVKKIRADLTSEKVKDPVARRKLRDRERRLNMTPEQKAKEAERMRKYRKEVMS